ncbi:MAG: SPOR domain-containing protein [Nitrospinae bacterium]|nr:SPOR domain-containing protein [Nitrospinota bacterium]
MAEEKISEDLEDIEKDLLKEAKTTGGSKRLPILLLILLVIAAGGYIITNYLPLEEETVEEGGEPPRPQKIPKEKPTPVESPDKSMVMPPSQPQTLKEKVDLPSPEKAATHPPELKKVPVIESSPSSPSEKKYTVQIGTYVLKRSLDTVLKEVKQKGFTPYEKTGISEITSYRVNVGEFQNADEMRDIVKKLIGNDIEVKFKIVSDGIYTLSAGMFYNKKRAKDFRDKLIEKGYPAKISEEKGKRRVYILRVGDYKDHKEAEDARASLSAKGIDSIIVNIPHA